MLHLYLAEGLTFGEQNPDEDEFLELYRTPFSDMLARVMRGEIEDSEYAMIFLRDITESKAETARRMQMASDNASMDL